MKRFKVPKQFKEALLARFDPSNAIRVGELKVIAQPCPVCRPFSCGGCPLEKYGTDGKCGCIIVLEALVGDASWLEVFDLNREAVWWRAEDAADAAVLFARIRANARELVEWV